MSDRVYNLLLSYGFTPLDIDDVEIDNKKIYNISYEVLAGNLKFLKKRRLDNDSIVKIIKNNPSIITGDIKKYKLIRNVFENTLSFSNEEFGMLINKNNNILTDQEVIDASGLRNYPSFILTTNYSIKNKLLKNDLDRRNRSCNMNYNYEKYLVHRGLDYRKMCLQNY